MQTAHKIRQHYITNRVACNNHILISLAVSYNEDNFSGVLRDD